MTKKSFKTLRSIAPRNMIKIVKMVKMAKFAKFGGFFFPRGRKKNAKKGKEFGIKTDFFT